MGKIHRINAKEKILRRRRHPFISDAYVCNA